jgi:predicted RNA binding protein YcfA (HicA-like mRNA interferase family)
VSEAPLCSSRQIVQALERAGFAPARRSRGSHQAFVRTLPDGTKRITVVVVGKHEVPRGTLLGIVKRAGLTVDEFLALL